MNRALVCLIATGIWAALVCPGPASAQGIRPKTLLVYYGFPSTINGATSVAAAAQEFAGYDYVLWGAGLEDPTHPDHANAVAIFNDEAASQTRFFGYVDVGVLTGNLPMSEIQARITRWQTFGVSAIQLDNFGYDFGTTRVRQNAAVDFAHALGLDVLVNAFRPADAFGSITNTQFNPTGAAPRLGASDFYFSESYGVRLGQFEDAVSWRARSDTLEAFRARLGFRILSTTTTATDDPAAYDEAAFYYAWHAALLYGHEATGWGEYAYCAGGVSSDRAPYRARPTLDPGNTFTGSVKHSGSLNSRLTDGGRLDVDSATHQYSFAPSSLAVPDESMPPPRVLSAFPNPSRGAMRFDFTLEGAGGARLTVYDAAGRRVAALPALDLSPGQHESTWTGLDDAGEPVAPGSYFVVLDSGGSRSLARFVVTR
jgi:hypothetical protein